MNIQQSLNNFFDDLSSHPELTTEILENYQEAPWNRIKLSSNINFDTVWQDLVNGPFFTEGRGDLAYWDNDAICSNPNFNEEWLDIGKQYNNYNILSRHQKFKYTWMNQCIIGDWDFDYILNRDDFTKEDILKVFLKPDQTWNSQILEEKYGKEWCIDYEKNVEKTSYQI